MVCVPYLGLGIVFMLLVATNYRPALVGIAQVIVVIAHNTRRAGIHERLDAGLLARLNDGLGTIDVDLAEELLVDLTVAGYGRGGVDDNIGSQLIEDVRQLGRIGNVALVVGCVGAAVLVAAEVDRRDVGAAPRVDGLVDYVVAKEAVAANDENLAEVAFLW